MAIWDIDEGLEKCSITCSPMDPLQWMGAVRIRIQTPDKNITIIHNTPDHQLISCEEKCLCVCKHFSIFHFWVNCFFKCLLFIPHDEITMRKRGSMKLQKTRNIVIWHTFVGFLELDSHDYELSLKRVAWRLLENSPLRKRTWGRANNTIITFSIPICVL